MDFLRVHKCQTAAERRESDKFVSENMEEEKKKTILKSNNNNDK